MPATSNTLAPVVLDIEHRNGRALDGPLRVRFSGAVLTVTDDVTVYRTDGDRLAIFDERTLGLQDLDDLEDMAELGYDAELIGAIAVALGRDDYAVALDI